MENCQTLHDLAAQVGVAADLPSGDLACAFVGEWNAGKSSLLNALTGINLPARPTATTKTVVRLQHAEAEEAKATITDAEGQSTTVYGHEALAVLQRSTEHLSVVTLEAPGLDIPRGVLFIDTPGFNDVDQAASTRAESVQADVVVFVLQATGSVINQTQVDFITQVLLTKGNLEDIVFVVTHADLLDDVAQQTEIKQRYIEQFGTAASERLFLVCTAEAETVAPLKDWLYEYLRERQPQLLAMRRERLCKQLANQLRQELDRRRALLALQRDQRADEIEQMQQQLAVARRKEQEQRNRLRENYRARLRKSVTEVREDTDQVIEEIEQLISTMTMERLQARGELQSAVQRILEERFSRQVEARLTHLLEGIEADMNQAQRVSSDLLSGLSVRLPVYDSPLAKVSAEHLLPLAAIGSVAIFGWLSIPTLLLGYLALKARDLGLTRADRSGVFDKLVETATSLGAGAYRQSVKTAVANAVIGYRDQVTEYLRRTVEDVSERALEQINGVEALEKSYWQLRDSSNIDEQEQLLDQIDQALTVYRVNALS